MNKIKMYFSDWRLFEKIWLLSFTLINIYLFFAWGDTVVGLLASLTGMLCVVLTAKGKISSYYPGIINVILYAYIAYQQKYFGEVMLNAIYFLPMQFVGIYIWSKHRVSDTGVKMDNVVIKFMTNKNRIFWGVISIISVYVYGLFLRDIGGNMPFIDSMSTVFSIVAMILLAMRYMEQWILWIVVDIVSIILWVVAFVNTGNDISMLVMWSAYLINAIWGLYIWIDKYNKQGDLR